MREGVWVRRSEVDGTNPVVPFGRSGSRARYHSVRSAPVTASRRSKTCCAPCALISGNVAIARADGLGAALATMPFETTVPSSVGCSQAAAEDGYGAGTLGVAAASAADRCPGVPLGSALPATRG